jgi:hypothetical protein
MGLYIPLVLPNTNHLTNFGGPDIIMEHLTKQPYKKLGRGGKDYPPGIILRRD